MQVLRPSREHARDHLVTALNGKGQLGYCITEEELDDVVSLYNAYDVACGAPSEPLKGGNLDESLLNAIKAAYDLTQRGRRLNYIRSYLMRGVEYCPICGISPPNELDHHLPKAKFKPLAIYVLNLIPVCGTCNRKKSAMASNKPEHRFIHVYLDELPQYRFLRANVLIEDDALVVEFEVDPDVDLPDELRQRLRYQLQCLDLNLRYSREINMYLTSQTTALNIIFLSGGAEAIRSYLCIQSEAEFTRFHRNHWRPVLLLSLKDHQGFCDGGFKDVLPRARPIGSLLSHL